MTLAALLLVLVTTLGLYPAWRVSRGRGDSLWLLFLGTPALVVWVLITGLGFGPQSLSNLVEALLIMVVSVPLGYVKVFALDRFCGSPRRNTYLTMAALVMLAVVLRAAMPLLPE